jgi:hypothetical protein
LAGRVEQAVHAPSAAAVHAARYCPTGQLLVLQAAHDWPLRKKPRRHNHAQLLLPYGWPAPV